MSVSVGPTAAARVGAGGQARARARLERPVFIVSAPRAGSTLLFETLAASPNVFTIGGESHDMEQIPRIDPASRDYDSNRLTAADADPETAQMLRDFFLTNLRDRKRHPPAPDVPAVRLLEKTPKNALRVSFLSAVFPDALFVFLYRDARENLSSIMEAWRSGRFVTYRELPGWDGLPWSLLLIPEWRKLRGRPVEEIAAAQWGAANRFILDDLAELSRDRWRAVSYARFLSDPQAEVGRICAFAGLEWDRALGSALPPSRYTLTAPAPDKWRKNAAEIERVLPAVLPLAARAEAAVAAEAD